MVEFVSDEVKYVKVGEPVGIAPLSKSIATVKFDVRSPGIYKVEVRQDGSWIAVKDYLCKKERINDITEAYNISSNKNGIILDR